MSIGEIKKLWKYFLVIFLMAALIINWNEISWLFNYKFISRGLVSFFEKVGTLTAAKELPTLEILKDLEKSNYGIRGSSGIVIDKENSIEIPKIGVKAPLVFPESSTESAYQAALKKGVLHYPQSVLPGEEGTTIILGHSAPPSWPKVNYDFVFNDLDKLEPGDIIYVDFNQRQYNFVVREKRILRKGQEIPQDLTNYKSVVILLSCWPPGTGQQRIAIAAELVI